MTTTIDGRRRVYRRRLGYESGGNHHCPGQQ